MTVSITWLRVRKGWAKLSLGVVNPTQDLVILPQTLENSVCFSITSHTFNLLTACIYVFLDRLFSSILDLMIFNSNIWFTYIKIAVKAWVIVLRVFCIPKVKKMLLKLFYVKYLTIHRIKQFYNQYKILKLNLIKKLPIK